MALMREPLKAIVAQATGLPPTRNLMSTTDPLTIRPTLIDLFRETGSAHHHAYLAADGADPDWPIWYAGYIQSGLNQLLGSDLTRSELVYLIVMVEKERAAHSPAAAWPDYYADFFLQRYGAMRGHMPAAPRM
jgi:hypothetical protein